MTAVRNDFLADDHGPVPARTVAPRLDAPASDDACSDNPWAELATDQRVQTATWIEEILADIDPGVRPLRLPPSRGRVRVRPSPKLLHQVSSRAVVAPGPVPDRLGLLTGERGEMQTEFTFVEQPAGGAVPATEPDVAQLSLPNPGGGIWTGEGHRAWPAPLHALPPPAKRSQTGRQPRLQLGPGRCSHTGGCIGRSASVPRPGPRKARPNSRPCRPSNQAESRSAELLDEVCDVALDALAVGAGRRPLRAAAMPAPTRPRRVVLADCRSGGWERPSRHRPGARQPRARRQSAISRPPGSVASAETGVPARPRFNDRSWSHAVGGRAVRPQVRHRFCVRFDAGVAGRPGRRRPLTSPFHPLRSPLWISPRQPLPGGACRHRAAYADVPRRGPNGAGSLRWWRCWRARRFS